MTSVVATTKPTVIETHTPPEPPVGSIVLTKDGTAWQSRQTSPDYAPRWYSTRSGIFGLTWDMFITQQQSVTLIHRPDPQ